MYGEVGIFEDNDMAIGLACNTGDWLIGKRFGDCSFCNIIGEWLSAQLVVRHGRRVWN